MLLYLNDESQCRRFYNQQLLEIEKRFKALAVGPKGVFIILAAFEGKSGRR